MNDRRGIARLFGRAPSRQNSAYRPAPNYLSRVPPALTPEPHPAAPDPWRRTESWVVAVIVTIFLLLGAAQYRERRTISGTAQYRENLRMLALALNAYRSEQGVYPPARPHAAEPNSRLAARLSDALTTPVSYTNRLLPDIYATEEDDPALLYLLRQNADENIGDPFFDALVRHYIGEPVAEVEYALFSRGPNGNLDLHIGTEGSPQGVAYDPTNGSRSRGDIVFWGPSVGFRRNPYAGTAAAGRGGLQ
jgi:hypothetical protein